MIHLLLAASLLLIAAYPAPAQRLASGRSFLTGPGSTPAAIYDGGPQTSEGIGSHTMIRQLSEADARVFEFYRADPRAWLADFPGLKVLTDDEEKHIEAIRLHDTVGACGSPGIGKSMIEGYAALWAMMLFAPTSCYFGGPTEVSTAAQAWKHFTRAYYETERRAQELLGHKILGGDLLSYSFSPGERACHDNPELIDHWARVRACADAKDGATLRGQLHARYALVLLQEVNGMAPLAVNTLWDGTRAPGARFWYSFNPIRPESGVDSAQELWNRTDPAGRVSYSLLRALEWQDKYGPLPGMTDRTIFERDIRRLEGTALWYPIVLGEYAPEDAQWVVVPKDWFDACLYAEPVGVKGVGIGIDTGRGKAENVVAVVENGCVSLPWISREQYQTPITVAHVKDICRRYPKGTPIAVDVVGTGGAGVADDLRLDGFNALDFNGGGREFAGIPSNDPSMDLFTDRVTWAWWQVRLAAEATFEKRAASVQFPDDKMLRDQLARGYAVAGERRFKLESKDSANSPDRADAVAMAWAAMIAGCRKRYYETPTTGEARGYRAERRESLTATEEPS